MKKKIFIGLMFLLALFLLILFFVGLIKMKPFIKKDDQGIIKEIPLYGYVLEDTKSKLFADTFDELYKVLTKDKINNPLYVELVSKLFVIDFYDLDNKLSRNDIGGIQFIHDDIKSNFTMKAKDTLYKYIENNLYNDRKQLLPKVKQVTVLSVAEDIYQYNGDNEAYKVILTWDYEKDLDYQSAATIYLIKEDIKFSIVELKEEL